MTATPRPNARPLVVFLDHCAAWSGGEIALARLLEPLEECRRLVVLAEDGPLVDELAGRGVDVRVLPLPTRTNRLSRELAVLPALRSLRDVARYVWRLRALLRRERPQLVHANSLKSGTYGCLAARLAGVPVVWHVRDRIAPDYLPARVARLVRLLLLLLPDAVVTNSRTTLDTLGDRVRRGLPTHVLADPYRSPLPPRPAPPRAQPVVALVGRLSPWKGQDLFLDAVERLVDHGVDVCGRLLGQALFGEEEYAERIRARLAAPPLAGRVALGSFSGDAAHALREVDVVVSASVLPEPFGQVVVEAIANGLPVVVPDQGGPAEIVEDGVSGLTYRSGDAADLAAALERLLGDPELHARLVAGGLRRADDFAPEPVAAEFWGFARSVRRLGAGRRLRALAGPRARTG